MFLVLLAAQFVLMYSFMALEVSAQRPISQLLVLTGGS